MKSYTSLEQSKILAEILTLESADMQWIIDDLGEPFPFPVNNKVNENEEPCWSLAALLKILPKSIRLTQDMRNCYDNPIYKGEQYKFELIRSGFLSDEWYIQYCGGQERQYGKRYYHNAPVELHVTKKYDNIVDACYEMISKLH